ncbi:MAG: porin [Bacteroidia bacterium]
MKGIYIYIFFLLCYNALSAQNLQLSGYKEVYYAYDFQRPSDKMRPFFTYNHSRHNDFSVNLGYLKAAYEKERLRANLALMTGSYRRYNLADEPKVIQFINEANVGYKLSKKKNIWLDAGIFASHIGIESAVGKDCWTLTRSMLAENSPYYESGAKLTSVSANQKWTFSLLALNGWQNVWRGSQRLSRISGGTQLLYKPSEKFTFNYSTFVGKENPAALRIFHNFYGIYKKEKWGLIVGLDAGTETNTFARFDTSMWFSPVIIYRRQFNDKLSYSVRAEYYQDLKEIIVKTSEGKGFRVSGASANFDYLLFENILLRAEYKSYYSEFPIFEKNGKARKYNMGITTAVMAWF